VATRCLSFRHQMYFRWRDSRSSHFVNCSDKISIQPFLLLPSPSYHLLMDKKNVKYDGTLKGCLLVIKEGWVSNTALQEAERRTHAFKECQRPRLTLHVTNEIMVLQARRSGLLVDNLSTYANHVYQLFALHTYRRKYPPTKACH